MTTPVPSMNAMVDSITDAVESVIHRSSNHPGGLRRFMLQGAVRHVLRDIHAHRIPPRRSSGGRPSSLRLEIRSSSCPVPRSSRLEFAPGVCPTHGPTMFVRRTRAPPETPLMMLRPAPPSLSSPALTMPRNGGAGPLAACQGAPPLPTSNIGAEAWPLGFAYDVDVPLLPLPPPPGGRSYAEVTRRSILPPRNALGAGFASSSHEKEAVPRC
jgi:hypothetical protein